MGDPMGAPKTRARPVPLVVAVVVVALEALGLALGGVVEFVNLDAAGSAGSAAAAGIFLVLCALGLGACARGLYRLDSWTRAPIVLAQLLMLGLAWNARHTATVVPAVLTVLAVVALAGVFHPHSLDALAAADDQE